MERTSFAESIDQEHGLLTFDLSRDPGDDMLHIKNYLEDLEICVSKIWFKFNNWK
jgi:hypothetical protein